MPSPLTAEEANSQNDPSMLKQMDTETPKEQQIKEFYKEVDGQKLGLLTTIRPQVGPVSRSMGFAKRNGPDFLFLANINSQKFKDISHDKTAQLTFQDSKSQNWVSITGQITKSDNQDKTLIKELYNPAISAWFGDLKDGKHNGTWEDPRMAVIELRPKYIAYWLSTVGKLGFLAEVGTAAATGQVAQNGVMREFDEKTIEGMRTTSK